MEKRRPTYDLDAVKEALGSIATLAMTTTALQNAAALGFDRYGVVAVIA
jgi:motility quorum-sensing regulator/GCU-specific mRNA interferase toxin